MKNKLIFQGEGGKKAYQWGKYNVGRGQHYNWDKHEIDSYNLYHWKRYNTVITGEELSVWKKYSTKKTKGYYTFEKRIINPDYDFSWDKYTVIPAGNITYSWNKYVGLYSWDEFTAIEVPEYKYSYSINPNTIIKTTNCYVNGEKDVPSWDYSKFSRSDFTKVGTFRVSEKYKTYFTDKVIFNEVSGRSDKGIRFAKTAILDSSTGDLTYQDIYRAYDGEQTLNPYINRQMLDASGNTIKTPMYINEVPIGGKIFCRIGHPADYLRIDLQEYPLLVLDYHSEKGDYINNTGYIRTNNMPEIRHVPMFFEKINETDFDIYISEVQVNEIEYTRTPIGTTYAKGAYVQSITNTNPGLYPNDSYQNGYWYIYNGEVAGDFVGQAVSIDPNEYIENEINSDGFYYGTKTQDVAYTDIRGDLIGSVTSTDSQAYPARGTQNGYWYEATGKAPKSQNYLSIRLLNDFPVSSSERFYAVKEFPTFDRKRKSFTISSQYLNIAPNDSQAIANAITQEYKYFVISSYSSPSSLEFNNIYVLTNDIYKKPQMNSYDNICQYTVLTAKSSIEEPGEFVGQMESASGYIQVLAPNELIIKTDFLNEVKDKNPNQYPQDGYKDGFWYIYDRKMGEESIDKGSYIDEVTGLFLNDYPEDGIKNDFWYVYDRYTVEQEAGNFIEKVTSVKSEEYPKNGVKNGYWYKFVSVSTDNYPDGFVDLVNNPNRNEYPDNGEKNGFWYIYIGIVPVDLYTITDTELLKGVEFKQELNPEEDYTIGTSSCGEITFTILDTAKDSKKYQGLTCRYYIAPEESNNWKLVGMFIVSKVQPKNKMSAKITAYDNISKFDIYVDEWIEKTKFPIKMGDMFKSLCQYCGCAFADTNFINNDFIINDNFTSSNTTGRQILQYIAQVSAGFAYARPNGTIAIRTYHNSGIELDSSKYTNLTIGNFMTKPIDKLVVSMTENDIGVSSGTGNNVYKITNNPLFFTPQSAEIQTAVNNIFNIIKQVVYTPCDIELLEDFNINCGDIISVDGKISYIMSKEISPSGVKLHSVGNEFRKVTGEETNSDIVALRGKTNELTRSIEETNSKITDVQAGLQSEIKQTADTINATVSAQGDVISQVKADVNGISLNYNSQTGTASITIGNTTVSELTDKGYVDKTVAGINLKGYVTFESLSNPGQTTINGNNITTGKISADRLNITGAISWGDLSDSAKTTIVQTAEDAASAVSGVPKYIQKTYIDAVSIYSPKIYGAEITAGTSVDGYIKMSSTGLNFCSKNGGSIMGIGYYASKYNLPYMVFGAGIDNLGTDRGLIKKYSTGIWIGDSDGITNDTPKGTGLFVNFDENKIYKYINGTKTAL